jgi:hypothetical protein
VSDDKKQCSRPGCGKPLRRDNLKGVCSSGCLSPEAPGALRAKDATPRAPAPSPRAAPASAPRDGLSALEKFRVVCDALGRDADGELEEFASEWLKALAEKLEEA